MAVTPKAPAFDGETFMDALDENIKRPDGKPYDVFRQFRPWKVWVDKLRDHVEANRVAIVDQKNHLDTLDEREKDHHAAQASRLAAIEAQLTQNPFPA